LNSYEKVFQVDLTEDEYSNISDKLETVVRKMAHMCEYAVLTILIFIHLLCCEVPLKKCVWIAVFVAVIYATTDEFHQRFVSGRSCELRDVLIDSIGSTLGGISFYFVMKWKDRRKIKRERLRN
jgi:VanZ family protein